MGRHLLSTIGIGIGIALGAFEFMSVFFSLIPFFHYPFTLLVFFLVSAMSLVLMPEESSLRRTNRSLVFMTALLLLIILPQFMLTPMSIVSMLFWTASTLITFSAMLGMRSAAALARLNVKPAEPSAEEGASEDDLIDIQIRAIIYDQSTQIVRDEKNNPKIDLLEATLTEGQTQDIIKASRFADQRVASAEYAMGVRYAKGLGVERNLNQARFYFDLAKKHNHSAAQKGLDFVQCDPLFPVSTAVSHHSEATITEDNNNSTDVDEGDRNNTFVYYKLN